MFCAVCRRKVEEVFQVQVPFHVMEFAECFLCRRKCDKSYLLVCKVPVQSGMVFSVPNSLGELIFVKREAKLGRLLCKKKVANQTRIMTITRTNLMNSLVTVLRVMLPDASSHPLNVWPLLLVLQQTHLYYFDTATNPFNLFLFLVLHI